MKILQILVSLFLFILTYDTLTVFLWPSSSSPQQSGGESEKGRNSFGGDDRRKEGKFGTSPWAVGGASLVGLVVARALLKKRKGKQDERRPSDQLAACCGPQPRKTESFLTCRQLSQMSICSEPDLVPNNSEVRMVPLEEVQMLLEEWRSATEDKFDQFDQRLSEFESSNRLCLKRVEQTESELSFIHHQIFLLAHKTRLPNLSEVPDSQQQIDTMKDLTKILVEVKEQVRKNSKKNLVQRLGDDDSKKSSEVQTELNPSEEEVVCVNGEEEVFETEEVSRTEGESGWEEGKKETSHEEEDEDDEGVGGGKELECSADEPTVELRERGAAEEGVSGDWNHGGAGASGAAGPTTVTNLPLPLAPPPPHGDAPTIVNISRGGEGRETSHQEGRTKTPDGRLRGPVAAEVLVLRGSEGGKRSKTPELRAKSVESHPHQPPPHHPHPLPTHHHPNSHHHQHHHPYKGSSTSEVRASVGPPTSAGGGSATNASTARPSTNFHMDIPPTETTKKIHFADIHDKKKGDGLISEMGKQQQQSQQQPYQQHPYQQPQLQRAKTRRPSPKTVARSTIAAYIRGKR